MTIKEIKSFSKWFKIIFFGVLIIYIGSWFYTIHIADFQRKSGLEPVMPIAHMDSTEYRNLTESILSGNGFAQFGHVTTLQSPGYPFFVAVLKYMTGSYFAATLVQIILVFSTAVIIRRMGGLFFKDPSDDKRGKKAGEIAASIFILNPVVWALSLTIMTDILFLFLFALGFYLVVSGSLKTSEVVISSIIFSMAIYTRPMGIFAMPIFIAPFVIPNAVWKHKVKSVFIMFAIIGLAVAPWVYRNYKITGVADFSSFKSANLSLYVAPMFLANINHTDIATEMANMEKTTGIPASKWRDLNYSKELTDASLKIIFARPFAYAAYHTVTSLSFLFSSSFQYALEAYNQALHLPVKLSPGAMSYLASGDWKSFLAGITQVWWKILERMIWVFIYAVTVFAVWKRRKEKTIWVFIFVTLYLMMLAGPMGNARYAVQSLDFKLLLFSAGAVWLIDDFKYKLYPVKD